MEDGTPPKGSLSASGGSSPKSRKSIPLPHNRPFSIHSGVIQSNPLRIQPTSNQPSINIQSTSINLNRPSITPPPRVIPRPREGSGAGAPTPVPVLNLFLFPPLFPLTYSVILLPDAFRRIYTLHTPHGPSTPSGPRTPQLLGISFDQFVPSPALSAPSPGRS